MSDYRIKTVRRRKEAAKLLGVSTKTLDRLRARGAIAFVAITDRIVGITDEEINRVIAERTVGGR